jgi:hypothetical protein
MILVDFYVIDIRNDVPKMIISGWDPIIESVVVAEVDQELFRQIQAITESGQVFTFWRDSPGVLSCTYITSATPRSG